MVPYHDFKLNKQLSIKSAQNGFVRKFLEINSSPALNNFASTLPILFSNITHFEAIQMAINK